MVLNANFGSGERSIRKTPNVEPPPPAMRLSARPVYVRLRKSAFALQPDVFFGVLYVKVSFTLETNFLTSSLSDEMVYRYTFATLYRTRVSLLHTSLSRECVGKLTPLT